eukprot:1734166-Amphidinium_carterae.1
MHTLEPSTKPTSFVARCIPTAESSSDGIRSCALAPYLTRTTEMYATVCQKHVLTDVVLLASCNGVTATLETIAGCASTETSLVAVGAELALALATRP